MAEKHVAVCDNCGKEEPLVGAGRDVPRGWVCLTLSSGGESALVQAWIFHAWSCAAAHSAVQAKGVK